MKFTIEGTEKEIAALVLEIQKLPKSSAYQEKLDRCQKELDEYYEKVKNA